MKKIFTLLFYSFILLSTFLNAETVIADDSHTITTGVFGKNRKDKCPLSITSSSNGFLTNEDIIYVPENSVITINYNKIKVSSWLTQKETELIVWKDSIEKKEDTKESYLLKKDESIVIYLKTTTEEDLAVYIIYALSNENYNSKNYNNKRLLYYSTESGYGSSIYWIIIKGSNNSLFFNNKWYFSPSENIGLLYKGFIESVTGDRSGYGVYSRLYSSIDKKNPITQSIYYSSEKKYLTNFDIFLKIEKSSDDSSSKEIIPFSENFYLDNIPPAIDSMHIKVSNTSWSNGTVTLTPTGATDSSSGLSHYEYYESESNIPESSWKELENGKYNRDKEGKSYVYFRAVDNVGNKSETKVAEVWIDKTKPTVSLTKSVPTGWQKSNVTLSVKATDSLSGVKSITVKDENNGKSNTISPKANNIGAADINNGKKEVTQEYIISDSGEHSITIEVEDYAGNKCTYSPNPIRVSIDKEKPTITIQPTAEKDGKPVWGNVPVTIKATDSNLLKITIDGTEVRNETTYNKTGKHTVKAIDKAGNEATKDFWLDLTPPVISTSPEVKDKVWTGCELKVSASDAQSGLNTFTVEKNGTQLYEEKDAYSIKETGKYIVTALDNKNNSSQKEIWMDRTPPTITTADYTEGWTKNDVTVSASDAESGLASLTVNGNSKTKLTETGKYTVKATDKVGNEKTKEVKIDKIAPTNTWAEKTFSNFQYQNNLVTSFDVNFSVEDKHSQVKEIELMYRNNSGAAYSAITKYNGKFTYKKELTRDIDNKIDFYVAATDYAGNISSEGNKKSLTIPKKICMRIVKKEEEKSGISRTRIIKEGNEEYTTAGILINKIDFDKYKTIKLKRTFLGNEKSGERAVINYEDYKKFFSSEVSESVIKNKWENYNEEITITADKVTAVTVNGTEYWYYEDKIPVSGGLGHKGIRYQPKWTWQDVADCETVTETGSSFEIDKTANTPGKLTLRIEGKDNKYIYIKSDGTTIEDENFIIPEDGIVKLSFKIEDPDAEPYNVQAREIVKATFQNEQTGEKTEEKISIPIEGSNSDGQIIKGKTISSYRKDGATSDDWFTFDDPRLKLYYNKPYNMKITMEEGCAGDNGNYKDCTESNLIQLKAGTPDCGGFKLLVGENAGYNADGITAQPFHEITFKIEEANPNTDSFSWDYGDESPIETENEAKHSYKQASDRTGNISEYTLTINCMKNGENIPYKHAYIPVHIVDTQYGMLFGDEEWIGLHPVTNRVQVPKDRTLTIGVNKNVTDGSNPTVILGIGSSVDEYRAVIEVNGKLIVEGTGEEKILFTEGKNGEKFMAISTEYDEPAGNDSSNKWKGIILNEGSNVTIKNATIRYAKTGLNIKGNADGDLENITISNCSDNGIETSNNINLKNVLISNCETGIKINKGGKVCSNDIITISECNAGIDSIGGAVNLAGVNITKTGKAGKTGIKIKSSDATFLGGITIENYEQGIYMPQNKLDGEIINITDITKTGIKCAGLKALSLTLKGDGGKAGIKSSGDIEVAGKIDVEKFTSGILMKGKKLTAGKETERYGITISGLSDTGIKCGEIEALSLNITGTDAITGIKSVGTVNVTEKITVEGFKNGIDMPGKKLMAGDSVTVENITNIGIKSSGLSAKSLSIKGSNAETGLESNEDITVTEKLEAEGFKNGIIMTGKKLNVGKEIIVTGANAKGIECGAIESQSISIAGTDAETGLKANGDITTGNITVSGFATGIVFSGKEMNSGATTITGSSVKGIETTGNLNAGTNKIEINAAGGKALETSNTGSVICGELVIEGTGDIGLESDGSINAEEKITVTGYKNGVNSKGEIKSKEIDVSVPESTVSEIGILNEGEITADIVTVSGFRDRNLEIRNGILRTGNITITGGKRGFILNKGILSRKEGENSLTLNIRNCKTGMHLLGGALTELTGTISNCEEYGIKIDENGTYNYSDMTITDCGRKIYIDGKVE